MTRRPSQFKGTPVCKWSIKKQTFFNREGNKLYSLHQEKKDSTSMWNTWVLWVFVFLHASNVIIATEDNSRQADLPFLDRLDWSCFDNTFWLPNILSQIAPSKMIWGSKIGHWLVCFLCKTLPKRLKFDKFDIYMFKGKKKVTKTICEICSFWCLYC